MKPLVVKVGGSSAFSPRLAAWVDVLATVATPLVIVPGGGPFADRVRSAQAQIGFSDQAAHVMAILAMEQFGHMLADLNPSLTPAATIIEIRALLGEGRIPVWMPSRMTTGQPDIPVSWDTTSDALAAWFSDRIGAAALLLVKQADDFMPDEPLEALAQRGLIDANLKSLLASDVPLYLAGPKDLARAGELLASRMVPGARVGMAGTGAWRKIAG